MNMPISGTTPVAPAPVAIKAPVAPTMPVAKEVAAPKPIAVQAPEPLRIDPVKMKMQIEDTVSMLNRQMEKNNYGLGFAMDRVANENVVTVRDSNTGAVIRQLPSEAVLKVAHSIESLKGIIYDRKI